MEEILRKALTSLFGARTHTVGPGGSSFEQRKPSIAGKISGAIRGYTAPRSQGKIDVAPPQQPQQQAPQPPPVEQQYVAPDRQAIEEQMRRVLTDYGGEDLPALNYIPYFMQAMEQYPMFAQNPYLLPQMSILESSGGQNITRPNNPLNWAARIQAQGGFNPQSVEESIMKAITGIGERFDYYEPFRQDRPLTPEEIEAFAQVYEPENLDYGRALREGIEHFQNF